MRMLITAGPTREPIDAVRYISNRSSGKMGIAVAQKAVEAGHAATLLLGPGPSIQDLPEDCRVVRFSDSAELLQLLEAHFPRHDALVMTAAVADYRPAHVVEGKLPSDSHEILILRLERTLDLVAQMATKRRPNQKVIAFALEQTENLLPNAASKLGRKGADAIVANPLETLDAESIEPLWLTASGERAVPGRMSKLKFASWLIGRIENL